MSDTIDRQAAVKALEETKQSDPFNRYEYQNIGIDWSIDAIKALPSAQPECEDAVSRFEVLRLIDYSSHDLNDAVDNRYMQNEIKQLPSVTPKQPGWIPCSDRLPKYGEVVLWCNQQGSVFTSAITWQRGNDYGVGQHYGVTAWMPLPKPWEGGQE